MIRPALAAALVDLASGGDLWRRAQAVEMTHRIVRFAAAQRPAWWQWTSYLAGAITIRRIEMA